MTAIKAAIMPINEAPVAFYLSIKKVNNLEWAQKKKLIQQGIPFIDCEQIRKEMTFSPLEFWKILCMKPSEFKKYQQVGNLPCTTTDKLVSLVDVFDFGTTVFESKKKFSKWLRIRNVQLNNQKPINVLQYFTGVHEVRIQIDLIAHR